MAVVGSTGYGSADLIRILESHPYATIGALITSSRAEEPLGRVFPHLSHLGYSLEEMNIERLSQEVEAVFFAAPPGVSSRWVPELVKQGLLCIDLAGDFRLDSDAYRDWYGREPAEEEWLEKAVYGLSEWVPHRIAEADLIANPGCYPTAGLLLLLPLLKAKAVDEGPLFIDAKSGVSGAGRGLKLTSLFCEVNENLFPYKVGLHQHTPEIERYASQEAGRRIRVSFTPQIVPMNRGILVTIYAAAAKGWNNQQLYDLLADTYRDAPFIRVRPTGDWPRTKQVQGSNFCDISLRRDDRTGAVVGMVTIDNLMKGAAGQAVQNLNLRMGWPETAGLKMGPQYP
nr:N-acetyl-gamma-glutamyl-phosphate reductase [Paludifilum halophilum]